MRHGSSYVRSHTAYSHFVVKHCSSETVHNMLPSVGQTFATTLISCRFYSRLYTGTCYV